MTGHHVLTARQAGLVSCHLCQTLSKMEEDRCPRCGSRLHSRKPDSLNRTWAFLIAGAALYIPANIFPIMTVISFGKGSPDTIFSGIITLINAGMIPIAALVFFASILVPVLKLLGLAFLVVSVQRRWQWKPIERLKLYRVIEFIGRWSMIDIFMISILIALVKLGNIATIEPGVAAVAFASVVVLTMFAATSFDPRLIWDNLDEDYSGQDKSV